MDTKTCFLCKTDKPLSEFNRNKHKKDGRQSLCRSCQNTSNLHEYHTNPARKASIRKRASTWRRELQRLLEDHLSGKVCEKCGNSDRDVLCFHHTRAKDFDVSRGVSRGNSWGAIYKEIQKCRILCQNCHTKLHKEQWRSKTIRAA